MPMLYNLYVPGHYSFKQHFYPKIKGSLLECYEVDAHRHGVQRKGNNHLVVFLDFCGKHHLSRLVEQKDGEDSDFKFTQPGEIKTFNEMFGHQKEVAIFSVSYHARMTVVAWRLLIEIADDDKVLVEDDEGNLMNGRECVRELRGLLV